MKTVGSYLGIIVFGALLGVSWLGWVVVLARIVARMIPRPPEPCEPIQAQVLGGPLDGLEFELHV